MTQANLTGGGPLRGERLDAFLSCPVLARVAGVRPDGRPWLVPVWHHWDGADLWLVGRKRADWCPYLEANPAVAVDIDVEGPLEGPDGHHFLTPKVIIDGSAEIVEPPGAGTRWVDYASKMAFRYRGDAGLRYIDATRHEQRWLIRIRPETVNSWEGQGWAKRYSST